MIRLKTALIQHTTAQGVHHDWLVEDASLPHPASPDARLWTARVLPPPWHWSRIGRFDLIAIPPHRRVYLTYQGPVSGNRGRVRRIASGTVAPLFWSRGRMRWRVVLDGFDAAIDARRISEQRWVAVVESVAT